MLSSLLFAAALAADCPDGAAAIQSAERDVVSYYLADAQASLAEAATAFGCSRADTPLLARYWLAQGMLWHLGDDPRYPAALAAAKQLEPDLFTEDFGTELRTEWLDSERLPGDLVSVVVRGKDRSDSILVDGMLSEPAEALPGMHLIQLRRGGEIVFGRLVSVEAGTTTTLDARVAAPAPIGPVAGASFEGPVSLRRGLRDGSGERLSTFELATVVGSSEPGLSALKRHRRTNLLQIPALALVGVGAYGTYLGTWELSVGDTLSGGQRTLLLGSGLVSLVGGAAWEVLLRTKRRKHRKQLVELVNAP